MILVDGWVGCWITLEKPVLESGWLKSDWIKLERHEVDVGWTTRVRLGLGLDSKELVKIDWVWRGQAMPEEAVASPKEAKVE